MRRSAYAAHWLLTGHTRFEAPDVFAPDDIVCLDCPGASPSRCTYPLTSAASCGRPVVPGTPFCCHHQVLSHLLTAKE